MCPAQPSPTSLINKKQDKRKSNYHCISLFPVLSHTLPAKFNLRHRHRHTIAPARLPNPSRLEPFQVLLSLCSCIFSGGPSSIFSVTQSKVPFSIPISVKSAKLLRDYVSNGGAINNGLFRLILDNRFNSRIRRKRGKLDMCCRLGSSLLSL